MSLCLHFCEEYKVRHSHNCIGNWQQENLNYVLKSLTERFGGEFWYSDDSCEYSDHIEIDKESVRKIVGELSQYGNDWSKVPVNQEDEEWVTPMMEELGNQGVTPGYLAEFLLDALNNGEQSIEYIRFTWL